MKHIHYLSRYCSFFLSFTLLIAPLPVSAIEQEITEHISTALYIDLSKEKSNIAEIISQLSDLDEQDDSLLHQLNAHIKNGFFFAEYNAVVETLEYAASVINRNYAQFPREHAEKIMTDLDDIIQQIAQDSLPATRAPFLPTLTINQNLDVLGKATFEKHVLTKQGIHVLSKLKVGKSAKFKKNVTIKDTLFVHDLVISGTVTGITGAGSTGATG